MSKEKFPVIQMVRTLGFKDDTPESIAKEISAKYAEGYTLLSAQAYAYQKQSSGAGEMYFPIILYTFTLNS